MATAVTVATKLQYDGSIVVPNEVREALGVHPGDEITVRLQFNGGVHEVTHPDQVELHRRAEILFDEADHVLREPGNVLRDPLEAVWAEGIENKSRRMELKIAAD